MEKLITSTGKEFDCDYFVTIPSPQQAYIRVLNTPIDMVALVFSNPVETQKVQFGENQISGYTKLLAIIPEIDAYKVTLAKE